MYNFKLAGVLFAFFDDYRYKNKDNFIVDLKRDVFHEKGRSTHLPVPDGVDKEIPRIILEEEGKFKVSFSESRIDYRDFDIDNVNIEESLNTKIEKFTSFIEEKGLLQKTKKLGIVLTYFDDEIEPSNRNDGFSEILLADRELTDLTTSSAEYRRVKEVAETFAQGEVKMNKIFKFDTNQQSMKTGNKFAQLEIDLNTFPHTDKLNIDKEFVQETLTKVLEYSGYVSRMISPPAGE